MEKYSEEYQIPKHIFYNVAYLESRYKGPYDSNYKHNLSSKAGALGPMQIMPSTAKFIYGKIVPKNKLKNDFEFNVELSAKLLNYLYQKYNDWSLVCGCYNTGRPIINKYAKFCVNKLNYQENWEKPNY
jgi:soluble lytic murein transglycosylase-like protein